MRPSNAWIMLAKVRSRKCHLEKKSQFELVDVSCHHGLEALGVMAVEGVIHGKQVIVLIGL